MGKTKIKGRVLLIAYLVVLVWILLFKFAFSIDDIIAVFHNQGRSINLLPFSESVIVNGHIDISEIINNLVIFIPFGGLLGILGEKRGFIKSLSLILLFSLLVEASQFILGIGATDITDIVMNSLGGVIGLVSYGVLAKYINRSKLDRFLVNIGTLLFSLILATLVFLLIFNM
ncbi:VanZ family protein [Vagococcus intermedius]|uniref:VanZ family protein n=1 Tax=Vagococcus intermedius TaxID=2991418 RepID=A0AAF0I849_9ENTE|nr:VanZ family protein [Vagococcus intermedius]WEG74010.1 VanZ family protein [Vagococcus intermedius]WEG76090.1 VanZ family protein [Vagococcus intermedius]